MKLTCDRQRLAQALKVVSRIKSRTKNIRLATDQGRLNVQSTDHTTAITMWLDAEVDEEGIALVPLKICEYVRSLRDDQVSIDELTVTCGKSQVVFTPTPAKSEYYLNIPSVEGLLTTVDPVALRTAINRVAFAAAAELSPPVLTGVHCTFESSSLEMAAADGFRLAVHTTELKTPVAEKTGIIVPAQAMTELGRLLVGQKEPVEVAVDNDQVLFRLKNIECVSQLIQGTFPNYQQLIPTTHTTRTVVDVQQMLSAVRQADIFAQDGSGIVRFQMAQGKMIISARAEELGDNVSEVDAVVEGEDAKVALNARYVLQLLSALKDGQVEMLTSSPSTPVMFKSIGGNEHETYEHVIMPMFVQW